MFANCRNCRHWQNRFRAVDASGFSVCKRAVAVLLGNSAAAQEHFEVQQPVIVVIEPRGAVAPLVVRECTDILGAIDQHAVVVDEEKAVRQRQVLVTVVIEVTPGSAVRVFRRIDPALAPVRLQ